MRHVGKSWALMKSEESSPHRLWHTAWRNDCSGPTECTWVFWCGLPPSAGTPDKHKPTAVTLAFFFFYYYATFHVNMPGIERYIYLHSSKMTYWTKPFGWLSSWEKKCTRQAATVPHTCFGAFPPSRGEHFPALWCCWSAASLEKIIYWTFSEHAPSPKFSVSE